MGKTRKHSSQIGQKCVDHLKQGRGYKEKRVVTYAVIFFIVSFWLSSDKSLWSIFPIVLSYKRIMTKVDTRPRWFMSLKDFRSLWERGPLVFQQNTYRVFMVKSAHKWFTRNTSFNNTRTMKNPLILISIVVDWCRPKVFNSWVYLSDISLLHLQYNNFILK